LCAALADAMTTAMPTKAARRVLARALVVGPGLRLGLGDDSGRAGAGGHARDHGKVASVRTAVWTSVWISVKPPSSSELRNRRAAKGLGTVSAWACTMVRVSIGSSESIGDPDLAAATDEVHQERHVVELVPVPIFQTGYDPGCAPVFQQPTTLEHQRTTREV
jgi:hypothetical protein